MIVLSSIVLLVFISLPSHTSGNNLKCGSGPTVCPKVKKGNCMYRSNDGSCSTPRDPQCGSIRSMYARLMPSRTTGRHGFPLTTSGEPFPNARVLSATLFPRKETLDSKITLNAMQYGQLITHDFAFTSTDPTPLDCCSDDMNFIPPPKTFECASINVTNDPFYKKYQATCVSMYRTETNRFKNCSLWARKDEPFAT